MNFASEKDLRKPLSKPLPKSKASSKHAGVKSFAVDAIVEGKNSSAGERIEFYNEFFH